MKIAMSLSGAATALLLATPVAAQKVADHDYGPPPAWSTYRQLAEARITELLVDPDSAKITWPDGYYQGGYKPMLEGRVFGYVACGKVNSRNRMGGYTGARDFIVVIDRDQIQRLDIARSERDTITELCSTARREGRFPPIPEDAAGPAVNPALAGPPSDLDLRATPGGAYISEVAPGSRAEAAGIKPGMMIVSVNGIPLPGMGEAMIKVVRAAGNDATLGMSDGSTIKLKR